MTEAIEPRIIDVEIGDKKYSLSPLKTGQIPKILKAVSPFRDELSGQAINQEAIVSLISDHGESVIEAVSIASGVNKDDIEAMMLDDFIELAVLVFEVNADFFTNRLVPSIKGLSEKLKTMTGSTASKS